MVYVQTPLLQIQQLTLQYRAAGLLSTVFALIQILLITPLFEFPPISLIWWIGGGLLAGFVIHAFRGGIRFRTWLLWGFLTPIIVGLVAGLLINVTVPGSRAGMAGYLATRNLLGGLLAAIGAHHLGVRVNRIVFASRVAAREAALREILYDSEIDPRIVECPNCGAELHSQTLFCGKCGGPLSTPAQDSAYK